MKKFRFQTTVSCNIHGSVSDFLSDQTGISRTRVKDAMNKGAVWLGRREEGLKRMRRKTARVRPGDRLEMHYDEKLLSIKPPNARCLTDEVNYSVWFKPAGLMSQGTKYGDHCSLLRQAELFFRSSRRVFLIHRLDREAAGVVIVAHDRKTAAMLSEVFRKNLIVKKYRVEVLGNLAEINRQGTIDFPLDGKPSVTEFEVESYDPESNTSVVNAVIRTGRYHQIRRHLDMLGFPVIGDPKYGKGNKNTEGMKLLALSLKFRCPFRHRHVEFKLPSVKSLR